MSKSKKCYKPKNALPYLERGLISNQTRVKNINGINRHIPYDIKQLSPVEKRIIKILRKGAFVLLDVKARRVLIYSCKQGLKVIKEITIRMLSMLLQHNILSLSEKHGRLIQYTVK